MLPKTFLFKSRQELTILILCIHSVNIVVGEGKSHSKYYSDYSSITWIPFFEKIPEEIKQNSQIVYDSLLNVEESSSIIEKQFEEKKEVQFIEESKDSAEEIALALPQSEKINRIMPTLSEKSSIMSETQLIILARLIPPIFRAREWLRLYSIEIDGVSVHTFYKWARNFEKTLLLIEDTNGYKFGAFASQEWKIHKHFYGTGETFLFTFKDTEEDIKYFRWTGANDHIQFSDSTSIAIGGSDGKFALYLRNNFKSGVSNDCKTFDNWVLSSHNDFTWTRFELWSFAE